MEMIINEIATNMPDAVLCHILTTNDISPFNYDEGKPRCPQGVYWSHTDLMGLVAHKTKHLSLDEVCEIFPITTYYIVTVTDIMFEGEAVTPPRKCYVYQSEDIEGDVEDFLAKSVNDSVKGLFDSNRPSDSYTYHMDIEEYTPTTVAQKT